MERKTKKMVATEMEIGQKTAEAQKLNGMVQELNNYKPTSKNGQDAKDQGTNELVIQRDTSMLTSRSWRHNSRFRPSTCSPARTSTSPSRRRPTLSRTLRSRAASASWTKGRDSQVPPFSLQRKAALRLGGQSHWYWFKSVLGAAKFGRKHIEKLD